MIFDFHFNLVIKYIRIKNKHKKFNKCNNLTLNYHRILNMT